MKMSLRFTAGALLALIMQAVCFAQHYKQTNLVSDTSGVAPVYRSSVDQPMGIVAQFQQPVVDLGQRDRSQYALQWRRGQAGPWSSPFRKSIQITRTPH